MSKARRTKGLVGIVLLVLAGLLIRQSFGSNGTATKAEQAAQAQAEQRSLDDESDGADPCVSAVTHWLDFFKQTSTTPQAQIGWSSYQYASIVDQAYQLEQQGEWWDYAKSAKASGVRKFAIDQCHPEDPAIWGG